MKRFTISLDDDLAVQLDRLMKERNYSNRSEVFRDILRDIIAKEDLTRGDAEALAVVSYSFNHHKRQLTERMNEIQHANIGLVVTAMHVHVSHEVCSETIILRGPVSEIQSLALSIVSAPGVHYGKINLIPVVPDEGDHDHPHEHEHDHGHHHHHSGMEEIGHLIGHLPVSERVRADIRAVYDSIAQAESHVHGVPVTDIHFHEVGTMDAVADVTAVCLLMEELAADQVIASPVHVGSGTVRCAHGVLPVPAPATAYLLRDVPIYGGAIQGELCTPTGAALLRHFVTRFGDMPVMTLETVGYGMGQKDFPRANCLRAMLGETAAESGDVYELACNLDDMTGEGIAFAMERLLAAGALDVYTLPIGMKKSRPGVMLCVLCREEQREDMVHLLLRHTTTLGVRETRHRRYTLSRSQDTVDSPWGPVARKTSQGWGVRRQKPEFEDLARIAREQGLTLDQVRDGLK